VESIPRKIDAYTEAEWSAAWNYTPHVPKFMRQLGVGPRGSHREALVRAAYFSAGRLQDEDFHLFANGGQPVLHRQRGDWFDEILFHAPPYDVDGHYSPVSVEILVSFEPLREIRLKYSRSYTSVPAFVAKANLGQLLSGPCMTIWNVAYEEAVQEIASLLHRKALGWIEELCDPLSLEDRVIEGTLPFVDDSTGLELVLALGGKIGARRVVNEWRQHPTKGPLLEREVRRLSNQFGPVYRSDDIGSNIAVLCICYDLWTRPRLTIR
jgi:hypothetical protein